MLRPYVLLIAFAAVLFGAGPGFAQSFSDGTTTLTQPDCVSFTDRAAQPENWQCGDDKAWSIQGQTAWLRFDLNPPSQSATGADNRLTTTHLLGRVSHFRALTIGIVYPDRPTQWTAIPASKITPLEAGPQFAAELPPGAAGASQLLVVYDAPWSASLLSNTMLANKAAAPGWRYENMLIVAGCIGLLMMAFLLDVSLFAILRLKMVVWHGTTVLGMAAYILATSGMLVTATDLSFPALAVFYPLSFVMMAVPALMFIMAFLGRRSVNTNERRVAYGLIAATGMIASVLSIFPTLPVLGPLGKTVFYLAFVPSLTFAFWLMIRQSLRGELVAKLLLLAWTPTSVMSLERITRGLGFYADPPWSDHAIYVALVCEVVVTSAAMAIKLWRLRGERDAAQRSAARYERLAETDALTGIHSRRLLDERFEALREEGYCALALFDLDHFKDINDNFGHQTGDDVLVAAAQALQGKAGDDSIAIRLGGEEFVVLLRGAQAAQRTERLRQAIAIQVARAVPGLDRSVTASVGLVEYGQAEALDDVYRHADGLAYQAKQDGRNRMAAKVLDSRSRREEDLQAA